MISSTYCCSMQVSHDDLNFVHYPNFLYKQHNILEIQSTSDFRLQRYEGTLTVSSGALEKAILISCSMYTYQLNRMWLSSYHFYQKIEIDPISQALWCWYTKLGWWTNSKYILLNALSCNHQINLNFSYDMYM